MHQQFFVFNEHLESNYYFCCNPSFGLATKARGCKVAGVKRKEARESKGRKPGSKGKGKGIGRMRAKRRKPGSKGKGKGIGRMRAKRRKPGSHHILPGV
jgi:hypothetical protein